MSDFVPKIKELLRKYGCYLIRYGKGDHEIWYSPITDRNITVDSKVKSRHTANGIMKDAGINHHF